MQWYLAKLVYRFICGPEKQAAQFDEQIRLIYAEDLLHAFNKAQLTGEREQNCLLQHPKQPAYWKFINVTELHHLEAFTDGAEVYSKIHEAADGNKFQHMVNVKAGYLSERCTEQFIQSI